MNKVSSCIAMRMNVKRRLYETVALPTALYGAKMWCMGVAEKILNVIEIPCLRSICEVMCMDRVRNEEVHRKTGVTRVGSLTRAECVEMV